MDARAADTDPTGPPAAPIPARVGEWSLVPAPIRRALDARPLLADALLALAFVSLALLFALSVTTEQADSSGYRVPTGPVDWLLIVGPALPIVVRRRAPAVAVALGGLAQAAVWVSALPNTFFLAVSLLLFSAVVYGGGRGRVTAGLVSALLTGFTLLGYLVGDAPLYAVPIVALFSTASAAIGVSVANRQAYVAAVEAQVRNAARSRIVDQNRAITEERNRIARELHDVVAHGLSVIVVQAAAAQRILDRDPDGARAALGQIETTGRAALGEMRHVLSVVRTDPDESWRPAVGLDGLDALVAELGQTGLEVAVDWSEAPDVGPLPATVDMTAYRIVQESLTNVLKHGGDGARAAVAVARRADALELNIVDDGRGAAADPGAGHGLRGMQERVEVFGGTLTAGPRAGGGFSVRAVLPVEEART